MSFLSDTAAPAHPEILDALARANHGQAPSYGGDELTLRVERHLSEIFETDVSAWLVGSGTAANALALSVTCPPISSVLCHAEAHIARDERGAPEFFTGGGKLALLPGAHAKIDLAALEAELAVVDRDFPHETPPDVLSLTNVTEAGALYTPDELAARAQLAKRAGLSVHLDGARFANAVAASKASPAELSWRAGVDVLTFGATKNGALGCEAIVLFGDARDLMPSLMARAKRAGHMPPKMRFLAAQMERYLEDGLWLGLAARANRMAARLAEGLAAVDGVRLAHPCQSNAVFAHMPEALVEGLRASGAGFYPWPGGSHRFVCSWCTTEAEIDALLTSARAVAAKAAAS